MLLLLLNYVVLRALWKIDVHLKSTLYYNLLFNSKANCSGLLFVSYH